MFNPKDQVTIIKKSSFIFLLSFQSELNDNDKRKCLFTVQYLRTDTQTFVFVSIRSDQSVRQRSMMSKKTDGNPPADVNYKILLLGDSQVGKTSLQRAIAGKDFRTDIGATIGKNFVERKTFSLKFSSFSGVDFVNKIIPVEGANVNLQIWFVTKSIFNGKKRSINAFF